MAESTDPDDVTAMIKAWRCGDEEALQRLMPLVYQELRRVAHARLRAERPGHILQTTALVHEAYLRFVDLERMNIRNRAHLLALAGRLMRQILVDFARKRKSLKRGGDITIISLIDAAMPVEPPSIDVLALDEALDELAALDSRLSRLVD
jgi:RNA polymerase sigma factor (TIGR02999 family)